MLHHFLVWNSILEYILYVEDLLVPWHQSCMSFSWMLQLLLLNMDLRVSYFCILSSVKNLYVPYQTDDSMTIVAESGIFLKYFLIDGYVYSQLFHFLIFFHFHHYCYLKKLFVQATPTHILLLDLPLICLF